MGKRKYTQEDYQYILEHYSDMTSSAIAKEIGCSRQLVLKIWNDNGLKGKGKARQYYFDFNYFSTIDSSNKAYILGLLSADGNLYKRDGHQGQTQILLHKEDEKILNDIKSVMNYGKPLVYFKDYCTLTFNSDILYNDLVNIGLYDNKTCTINISNLSIPERYIFDYLRGYFDGDGSIFKYLQTTCKNITPCCYNVTISGFIHNLKSMQEILLKYNIITQISIDKRSKEFGSLIFGSNKDKYFFLKSIYMNSNYLLLQRKYDLSLEYIRCIESSSKYDNIVNAYAVYGQDSQKSIDY